jgi:hypothetical protein
MLLDPLKIILHFLLRTAGVRRENVPLRAQACKVAQSMVLLLNSPRALSPRGRPSILALRAVLRARPTFARYSPCIGWAPQPRNRELDRLSSAYRTLVVSAHPRLRSVLTVNLVRRTSTVARGDVERPSVNRIPLR